HALYRSPATIPNKAAKGSTGYALLSVEADRIKSAAGILPYMGMIYAIGGFPDKHGVIIDVAIPSKTIWTLQVIESLGGGYGPRQSEFEVDTSAAGPIFPARRKTPYPSNENVFIVRYHG